jgi:hypothetical protein
VDVTKQQLENLYTGQSLTVRQCAESLGMPTHGGVQWLLKKFNIERRPSGFQVGNRKKGDRLPEAHGSWKGGKQSVPCTQCEAELFRFPSLINEKNFCDDACYGKWRSENFKGEANPNHGNSALAGEANPNWKGGIACEPYAPIWVDKRFKAGIRERDSFTCQNPDCRKDDDGLVIHHIDYDKKNCEPKNLITLCRACNGRANFNRDFWQAGYSEIIRLKYEAAESIAL